MAAVDAAVDTAAAAAETPDEGAAATDASVAPGTTNTKRWFPLESNPQIMNNFIEKMGFPVDLYSFTDVFSTEEWALEMVPGPTLGVVFLYPIKESTEEFRAAEKARIETEGQVVDESVYYMKQTVGNACGTVGILHACGNIADRVAPKPNSYLETFFGKTKSMSPDEIAEYLNNDDSMDEKHEEASTTNEDGEAIDPSTIETDVNTHFICFTEVNGSIYELDGRKASPINHGPSSPETLLSDACRVVKGFMERDEGEHRFTIVALAPTVEE